MSYSPIHCINYFSPLQVGKMNHYYNQIGISYPFYSLNGSNYVCSGQTAYYSVSSLPGVSNYVWETSSNLPITSGQGTNTITVEATDNNGGYVKVSPECGYKSRSRSIRSFYDLEINGYDTACAQGGSNYNYNIASLWGASYSWSITNGIINYGQGTTSVNITLSPDPSNQTWLTLEVSGVCAYTIYEHKIITHGDPPPPAEQCISYKGKNSIDISDNNSINNDILIFPNPASSNVNVVLPDNKDYSLKILDINGRIIYTVENNGKQAIILDLQNYQSGIYFISAISDISTTVKRLVIKK